MKLHSYTIIALALLYKVVHSYNRSNPVRYLGEPEPLWSGGAAARGFVFTGGVTGTINGTIVEGGIKGETVQTLSNMAALFEEAGTSWHNVLMVTIFLKNITRDLAGMNEVYKAMVPDPKPGRTTVEISSFVDEFLIEAQAVAVIPYGRM